MHFQLSLLLQANPPEPDLMGVVILFLLSLVILVVLGSSGKVNMGFKVPGFSRPMSASRRKILEQYFPYYNSLSMENKLKFDRKLQHFIDLKHFIPRNIPVVNEEMKVLIAACAVQLTFGFPKVMLAHFNKILIYPDDYYSRINHAYHRGEVNPRMRVIVLSWKAFVEGYINPTNGRNLGLHEMAHALKFENRIFNKEFEFLDKKALIEWGVLAREEIIRIHKGQSRMFREYAGNNEEEFFSVAIENFFERPKKFKTLMPKLYANLALLLKQDPIALY